MSNTTHFNPEYEYLVNELKLKKTKDCLAEMSYQQLKDFILMINPNKFTKKELDNELESWIMNIKHTYELLNQIPNIESKDLTIYFEVLIKNGKIDTLIKTNKGICVIEYSHLQPNENYEDKFIDEKRKLSSYCNYIYKKTNKIIVGMIYFDNIDETINRTLETLKDFLN